MLKPDELWTFEQATVWIVCTFGEFASTKERDRQIARWEAKIGASERMAWDVHSPRLLAPAGQNDRINAIISPFRFISEQPLTSKISMEFSYAWDRARTELIDEFHRERLSIRGTTPDKPKTLQIISSYECARLVFGEENPSVHATYQDKPSVVIWRSIRFEAAQIAVRWPAKAAGANHGALPNVAVTSLTYFLNGEADGTKTESFLREVAKKHFAGRHIPEQIWRGALGQLDSTQRNKRGRPRIIR